MQIKGIICFMSYLFLSGTYLFSTILINLFTANLFTIDVPVTWIKYTHEPVPHLNGINIVIIGNLYH